MWRLPVRRIPRRCRCEPSEKQAHESDKRGLCRLHLLVFVCPHCRAHRTLLQRVQAAQQLGRLSLKWYASLFQNDRIISALGTTLLLALLSAAIATVIGTAAAIGLHNLRGPFRSVLLNLTYIPMLNPDIVTGVAMLLLFTFVGYSMGFSSLLLSHIAFNIPYVVMSVLPKLKQMNPNLLDAAMDLGMKPATAITKVVVPEVMPGVVTGFLLAITMSIDDFVISFFTTGPGVSTLSIEIYSMTRARRQPRNQRPVHHHVCGGAGTSHCRQSPLGTKGRRDDQYRLACGQPIKKGG